MNRRIGSFLATAFAVTLAAQAVLGFAQTTHEKLSASTVEASNLDDFLKSFFPEYWQGTAQLIGPNREPVIDLIADGSHDEDGPWLLLPFQVVWHFHDPTRSWDQAGLLGGFFDSSIRRQQEEGVRYMWPHAREMYRRALLAKNPANREFFFQETFRSVGHLVHFVQDAASPAHTRDDPHLLADGLHTWAAGENRTDNILDAHTPIPFSGDQASPTSDSNAPRPVARIIDATEADRAAPAWTTDIGLAKYGLAEYSNSQFLSDDRTFGALHLPEVR